MSTVLNGKVIARRLTLAEGHLAGKGHSVYDAMCFAAQVVSLSKPKPESAFVEIDDGTGRFRAIIMKGADEDFTKLEPGQWIEFRGYFNPNYNNFTVNSIKRVTETEVKLHKMAVASERIKSKIAKYIGVESLDMQTLEDDAEENIVKDERISDEKLQDYVISELFTYCLLTLAFSRDEEMVIEAPRFLERKTMLQLAELKDDATKVRCALSEAFEKFQQAGLAFDVTAGEMHVRVSFFRGFTDRYLDNMNRMSEGDLPKSIYRTHFTKSIPDNIGESITQEDFGRYLELLFKKSRLRPGNNFGCLQINH